MYIHSIITTTGIVDIIYDVLKQVCTHLIRNLVYGHFEMLFSITDTNVELIV